MTQINFYHDRNLFFFFSIFPSQFVRGSRSKEQLNFQVHYYQNLRKSMKFFKGMQIPSVMQIEDQGSTEVLET